MFLEEKDHMAPWLKNIEFFLALQKWQNNEER